MTIRNILNKFFWDQKEDRRKYNLVFIHRGVPGDMKTIDCDQIKKIESSGFSFESLEEGEVFIPFHRVLEIKNIETGQTIWKKVVRNERRTNSYN